jgi:rod shape-determining protein MreC
MLWDSLAQIKEVFSIIFCIGFSVISLIFNSNFAVKAISKTQIATNYVSSGFDSVGGFFKGAYKKLESYESIREERDSYLKLVEEYKALPQDILALKTENEQLKKELGFIPKTDLPFVKAEVLSVRLNSIYRTIIINKGKEHGIKPYMPVVAKAIDPSSGQPMQALVGKIIAVNNSSSVVQPIINSNFIMGVQIPKTNIWATLSGNSGRNMQAFLNYIDNAIIIDPRYMTSKQLGPQILSEAESIDVYGSIGRIVYSSKGGGIFPADIPVGIIVEEGPRSGSFKTAYVKPFVKFEELEFVSILKKLPDKWVEDWPEEKAVSIENPYYGELNYPGEIIDPKDKNQASKKTKEVKPDSIPPKKRPIDEDEDSMLKKLEEQN